ncbi:PLP-dependent lyase/thiolase [Candidatus Nomurabacteria bacterium]|uniref:PLP-dependent lyase/thiolase n=1 Tax=candidate division WWE3 bacterium TaxID=2053526 RepID=A0A955LVE1_UNCKA|nr:PLP-dependent lyase/thiolase [candidate division WWE3 bacterium]MCB9812595.1 PLP-dependent lyase/thiolase [Candidatus Nomurabacteria bacterium]
MLREDQKFASSNLLKKLQRLQPLLTARVVQLETDLFVMLGAECFSGSLKGLSAYSSLQHTLQELGEQNFKGKTLLDASSGNFARALSHLGEYLNLDCEVVVSTKATQATLDLIKAHGAKVTIGGDTTLECYEKAKMLAKQQPEKYILTAQLDNWGNPQGHYDFTAPQIFKEVPDVQEIYMAMGSGGGVSGVTRYCAEHVPGTKVFVTIAKPGNKIVGTFSDDLDYETPFIHEARVSGWIAGELPLTTEDAKKGMIEMRKKYGLLTGFSAGGVYTAFKRRKEAGETNGPAIILAWDGHDRWIEKLN